jgi:hypothetical protein
MASLPFFLLDGLSFGPAVDFGGRRRRKEAGRALVIGRECADGDDGSESR